MAVFEVIGYIFNGLAFCDKCGRDLPYVDDNGHDRKRIYGWQRNNYSLDDDRWVVCPLCNKPANKWGRS